jgi:multiple sugar transport system permease protein
LATAVVKTTRTPGPGDRARRWASGFRERDTWWAYAFLLPWAFGFVVFTAGAMVWGALISFTNYSVVSPSHNVGLANYRAIASDPYALLSLKNSFEMTAIYVPFEMGLALLFAMMLARLTRFDGFFRTVFYLPVMTPTVAIGGMYLLMFNGPYGIVDQFLGFFHIPEPYWLTDPNWIKPGIAAMLVWQVGGNTVLYLAAIKNVPQQLYEAASIDGASAWRRFKDVTLPMISPTLFFTFVILTVYGLQVFDQIYTAFYNPSNAKISSDTSLMYVIYLFQQAFDYLHMGFASAMAWLLFGIIMVITMFQILVSKRFVYYEGEQK